MEQRSRLAHVALAEDAVVGLEGGECMQRPLRVWEPALVEPQPNWSRRVVSLLDAQSFFDPPK